MKFFFVLFIFQQNNILSCIPCCNISNKVTQRNFHNTAEIWNHIPTSFLWPLRQNPPKRCLHNSTTPHHFCRDIAEPGINNAHNNVETSFTKLQIHALSVLWARMNPINKSRWINNTSMNCKCVLVRSRVLRGREEGGLLAQVNEVVWECGLGPDCSMCGARFSLRGICSLKTTGETIFACGCICTCSLECLCMLGCMCAYALERETLCDTALRMTQVEALLSLCLMLAFVH